MAARVPSIADVHAARGRLPGLSLTTPLLTHPALAAAVGGTVLLKAESLQRVVSKRAGKLVSDRSKGRPLIVPVVMSL